MPKPEAVISAARLPKSNITLRTRLMDASHIEAWLAMLVPVAIGFALPRAFRRPLILISTLILVISLLGQGVHDDHFYAYFCNLFFLVGSIVRECVNLVVRTFRFAYRS